MSDEVEVARVIDATALPLPLTPIQALAALLREAMDDLNLVIWNRRQESSELALAAHLVVAGYLFHGRSVSKWCSLVEPGDLVGEQVVVHAQSSWTTRTGSSVEFTTATPVVADSLETAEWTDHRVHRFSDPHEEVAVRPGFWPVRR